jgi:hypothetical protein
MARALGGNTTGYTLSTESDDTVFIRDFDNKAATIVGLRGPGLIDAPSVMVHKNASGRYTKSEYDTGTILYYDLDGDGEIDGWVNKAKNSAYIIFDDHVTRIREMRVHFLPDISRDNDIIVYSYYTDESIVFKRGKWKQLGK